jgi:hypothetical protein
MVWLRAMVLGRMGGSSPHPRACALSCPPSAIYGPGKSRVSTPGPHISLTGTKRGQGVRCSCATGADCSPFPSYPFTGRGLAVVTPGPRWFYSLSGFSQTTFGVTCRYLLVTGRERNGGGVVSLPTAFRVLSRMKPGKGRLPEFPNSFLTALPHHPWSIYAPTRAGRVDCGYLRIGVVPAF